MMKNLFNSKTTLALLVAMLVPMAMYAYDIKVGNIYYNTAWENATVTSGDIKYTGDVVIPATVTCDGKTYKVINIGNSAFRDCDELTSVTIKGVIEKIGDRAFAGCKLLKSINLPYGLTEIWTYAFESCESLKRISIPSSVTKIEGNVFWNCIALESVSFGNTNGEDDMRIYDYIFSGTKGCPALRSVIYGNNVARIDLFNFRNVIALDSIVSYRMEPPMVDERTFKDYLNLQYTDSIYEHTTLYVRPEALAAYKAHEVWGKFFHIKSLEDELSLTVKYADNGVVKLMAEKGQSYELAIEPASGWKIHSVTYDGEDVTSQLSSGNIFKTPAVTKSCVLNVAFEQTGSAVQSLTARNPANVTVRNGQLVVDNIAKGTPIAVYTIDGKLRQAVKATGTSVKFVVEPGQVYIVRTSGKVVKVAL